MLASLRVQSENFPDFGKTRRVMEKREGSCHRETKETRIELLLNLDGEGKFKGGLGLPFFEHMLELFVGHGLFDLELQGKGDIQVDWHHTVEDVGICLGRAFLQAIGDKKGIERYGYAYVPMEEALALCVVDICDRPFLKFNADIGKERVGDYDSELTEEFLRAFVMNARVTMHIILLYGSNTHHIHEAIFKSAGRALRMAVSLNPRVKDVPSTKGIL